MELAKRALAEYEAAPPGNEINEVNDPSPHPKAVSSSNSFSSSASCGKASRAESERRPPQTRERAAISEFDAGIPRHWAEGYARLQAMPRPDLIPAAMWDRMIDAMGRLLDRHAAELVRLGWDAGALFAIDRISPVFRTDRAGLVRILAAGRGQVEKIESDCIVIRSPGGQQRFRRAGVAPGGALLWELGR